MTMSPQLRASPDTRNVHDTPATVFCAAWASQTDRNSPARTSRDRDPLIAELYSGSGASARSTYFGRQRGEFHADDSHLKRVCRVSVEHVEVAVSNAQLAQDVMRSAGGLPEPLLVCPSH